MFKSSNPILERGDFSMPRHRNGSTDQYMTMGGFVNKALILFVLMLLPAAYIWQEFFASKLGASMVQLIMMGGLIGGFIFALVTVFKVQWAPYTTPAYAICEGFFIGAISAMFETAYPGIVIQAVGLTFSTFAGLLAAYQMGIIKATNQFRKIVIGATMGIGLIYFVSLILSFFGTSIPLIHESGPIGIGFSIFVVGIAALNLVLDFDRIESKIAEGAPKYMEWYSAFGLLVTLIWLYIEFLRLIAKLRSRR